MARHARPLAAQDRPISATWPSFLGGSPPTKGAPSGVFKAISGNGVGATGIFVRPRAGLRRGSSRRLARRPLEGRYRSACA